jgi:hypothetical protein
LPLVNLPRNAQGNSAGPGLFLPRRPEFFSAALSFAFGDIIFRAQAEKFAQNIHGTLRAAKWMKLAAVFFLRVKKCTRGLVSWLSSLAGAKDFNSLLFRNNTSAARSDGLLFAIRRRAESCKTSVEIQVYKTLWRRRAVVASEVAGRSGGVVCRRKYYAGTVAKCTLSAVKKVLPPRLHLFNTSRSPRDTRTHVTAKITLVLRW